MLEADLDCLDDDAILESIRQARMQALAPSFPADEGDTWGYLSEIGHEKELLHMSTTLPRLLVHFYNPKFKSCCMLNEHLGKLSRKFPRTRIVYIDAAKAPFMIVKMQIQMLPCLVAIVDSLAVDRIVGFDELGGKEEFTTKELEERLSQASRVFQVPRLNFRRPSNDNEDSRHGSSDSE